MKRRCILVTNSMESSQMSSPVAWRTKDTSRFKESKRRGWWICRRRVLHMQGKMKRSATSICSKSCRNTSKGKRSSSSSTTSRRPSWSLRSSSWKGSKSGSPLVFLPKLYMPSTYYFCTAPTPTTVCCLMSSRTSSSPLKPTWATFIPPKQPHISST